MGNNLVTAIGEYCIPISVLLSTTSLTLTNIGYRYLNKDRKNLCCMKYSNENLVIGMIAGANATILGFGIGIILGDYLYKI